MLCKVQDLINQGGTPTLIDLDLAQLHPLCREDEEIIYIRNMKYIFLRQDHEILRLSQTSLISQFAQIYFGNVNSDLSPGWDWDEV